MPPRRGEAGIAALEGLHDRHTIQDGEVGDRGWMIHGGAEGRVASAIMADQGEAVETEMAHERHAILGLGALGGAGMIGGVSWLRRLAEAAQIGTDHRVSGRQQWRHPMPGRVGPGMPMQQQHRRTGTTMTDA